MYANFKNFERWPESGELVKFAPEEYRRGEPDTFLDIDSSEHEEERGTPEQKPNKNEKAEGTTAQNVLDLVLI